MRLPETLATGTSPVSPRMSTGTVARAYEDSPVARELAERVRRSRAETAQDEERSGFRLGWKTSALLNLLLLSLPIGLVIALPPFLDCRERAERFGLFAGDTTTKCTQRGIRQRLNLFDARLKMLVRSSGH